MRSGKRIEELERQVSELAARLEMHAERQANVTHDLVVGASDIRYRLGALEDAVTAPAPAPVPTRQPGPPPRSSSTRISRSPATR